MFTPLKFVEIGKQHWIQANMIVLIFSIRSRAGLKHKEMAIKDKRWIDATSGDTLMSVIYMENGVVVGSSLSPFNITRRMNNIPRSVYQVVDDREMTKQITQVDLVDSDEEEDVQMYQKRRRRK